MKDFFKKLKNPPESAAEAKSMLDISRKYFLISLGVLVGVIALYAVLIKVLEPTEGLVGIMVGAMIVSFLVMMFFVLCKKAAKNQLKRFKNITCDCGTIITKADSYIISSRHVSKSSSTNTMDKYHISYIMKITTVCPKCGKKKTFVETLSPGDITVRAGNSVDVDTINTDELVQNYFDGFIKK